MDGESKSERLQILLAILLGSAALATAWAAYRGDLYSGDSLIKLNGLLLFVVSLVMMIGTTADAPDLL